MRLSPRARKGLGFIILSWVAAILAGCAVYVTTYKTKGDSRAQCGNWSIELQSNYIHGAVVGLSAEFPPMADRIPFVDEYLQVDSLVVTSADRGNRWVTTPGYVSYRLCQKPASAPSDCFRVEVVDSVRCLVDHVRITHGDTTKAEGRSRSGKRLLILDRPMPVRGTLEFRTRDGEQYPIDSLERISLDEIVEQWQPRLASLEVIFLPYRKKQGRHDRRLEVYLRSIERKSGEILCTRTLLFNQGVEGDWKLSFGE